MKMNVEREVADLWSGYKAVCEEIDKLRSSRHNALLASEKMVLILQEMKSIIQEQQKRISDLEYAVNNFLNTTDPTNGRDIS